MSSSGFLRSGLTLTAQQEAKAWEQSRAAAEEKARKAAAQEQAAARARKEAGEPPSTPRKPRSDHYFARSPGSEIVAHFGLLHDLFHYSSSNHSVDAKAEAAAKLDLAKAATKRFQPRA